MIRCHLVQRLRNPAIVLSLAALLACPAVCAQDSKLTTLSLEQLLNVTITGASKYEQKQSQAAAAVSVITRDEIKTFGWRTLGEALASLPGVHTTYDRQYAYLGTRGFGLPGDLNTRVLVMINGNRINDPVYDAGVGGREFPLDLDLIERIEFIPGPGGAVYGQNAMFGVVNVVTRGGVDVNGAEVAVAFQSPQAQSEGRLTWGKVLDNGVDVMMSASGLHARGANRFYEFGSTGVSGVASGLDGEKLGQFFARVSGAAWSFELIHGDRRKDDPTASYFSDPLVPSQHLRDTFWMAQAQYQGLFADEKVQLSGRVFAGTYRFRSEQNYGTLFSAVSDGNWLGTEWRVVTNPMTDLKLMAGIDAQENAKISLAQLDLVNPANNVAVQKSGYRVGIFGQGEWTISKTLVATLGLRLDRADATGVRSSPRAALIWQAMPATTLKALAGRAYRAPNAFERDFADGVAQVANPELGGETIDTFELVADQRVNADLHLRASVYQWDMQNLISLGLDPASGLTQFQAGRPVTARGVELVADQTWGNGARLRGSLSVQNVSADGGTAAGRLINSPKLLGKLNFSSPLPYFGLRLGYELQYDSQRLSLDGTELGDYAVSNLHLTTSALANGLELSLGIYNLFDKRYAHPGSEINWQNALEQDGRSVRLKLSYRF
jgi:outer membrane receptor for ferrienterochelin and colicin